MSRASWRIWRQQTAMLEQHAILLQAHIESERFQRSPIERLLSGGLATDAAVPARQPEPASASAAPLTTAPPLTHVPTTPASQEAPVAPVKRLEPSDEPADNVPPVSGVTPPLSGPPNQSSVDHETAHVVGIGVRDEGNAAYTARYYRAPSERTLQTGATPGSGAAASAARDP
jgi:hypothetical protein